MMTQSVCIPLYEQKDQHSQYHDRQIYPSDPFRDTLPVFFLHYRDYALRTFHARATARATAFATLLSNGFGMI